MEGYYKYRNEKKMKLNAKYLKNGEKLLILYWKNPNGCIQLPLLIDILFFLFIIKLFFTILNLSTFE